MFLEVLGGAIVLLIGFGILMLVVDPEPDPKDNDPKSSKD